MSADKGRYCGCTTDHRPGTLLVEQHHVWPLGMGGPDIASNVVWICPTTHYNAHELLRMMVEAGRVLSWREVLDAEDRHPVSRYAYHLAVLGYTQAYPEGNE